MALNIASDLELNPSVKRQVKQLATTVQQGKSIRQYTTQGHIFGLLPPYMLQILSIGEETSHCSQLLDSLIADYQQRLHNMIQISMSLIEPALMLGLGLLIGLLIMAVYLPLFNLGNLSGRRRSLADYLVSTKLAPAAADVAVDSGGRSYK